MTQTNDPRVGVDRGGFVQITAANGNTPQTAVDVRSDALYRVTKIKIEYEDAATATTAVSLYDDADGTSAGNVGDQRDYFPNIDPDMSIEVEAPGYALFEEDVLVQGDNNQDANISVTIYGEEITDLRDMMSLA